MGDRRYYESDEFHEKNQRELSQRHRIAEFEKELRKHCSDSDTKKFRIVRDTDGNHVVLGRGAFGNVYEAYDSASGRPVALKVIKKELIHQNKFERRVLDEIRIHKRLMHPRIVEMYECFHDEKRVYISMELCTLGDLERFVKRTGVLTEESAASIFRQIVDGVLYLHRVKTDRDGNVVGNQIIHRDLKPSNICIAKDNSVKICDFNLATEVLSDDQKNVTYCGTPGYMPPEVAMNIPYSFEVDAYGLGCILYCMLFGAAPGATSRQGPSSNFDVRFPEGQISVEAENLLRNLLCKDGRQRMPIKAIAKDPFLLKNFQRKRVASIDSGFDTQHTGSSFPERSSRRAASRDRVLPRPLVEQQALVPLRRPPPIAPLRPLQSPRQAEGQYPQFAQPQSSFASSSNVPAPPPPLRPPPSNNNVPRRMPISPSHRMNHHREAPMHDRQVDARDIRHRGERSATMDLPSGIPASFQAEPKSSRLPAAENAQFVKPTSPNSPVVPPKRARDQPSNKVIKIRYVTPNVLGIYFNTGEFVVRFTSGGKVASKKRGGEIVVFKDKKLSELTRSEDTLFKNALGYMHAWEDTCSRQCGEATCACFPVLVDTRPGSQKFTSSG